MEPQRAAERVAESVADSAAEGAFDAKRRRVLAMLGFDPETPAVVGGDGGKGTVAMPAKLLTLNDADVLDVLAIAMGETLFARDPVVDARGVRMGVDMAELWSADDAFLDGLRDREVLTAMVAEVAGEDAARANAKESGPVLRGIIRDAVRGNNGRTKRERWTPRWLAFPAGNYTGRGGVGAASRSAQVAGVLPSESEPQAAEPTSFEPLARAA